MRLYYPIRGFESICIDVLADTRRIITRDQLTGFLNKLVWSGDCQLFMGKRLKSGGYGAHIIGVDWDYTNMRAHRLSHIVFNGPIVDGLWVLHSCDNPPCCNPKHLSLGTPLENARQAKERGRARHHVHTKPYKVTPDMIVKMREMRARGLSYKHIGPELGVSWATVRNRAR